MTVRLFFGRRFRNAELRVTVRLAWKTTGLPPLGVVLVAGAVAMPMVTSDTSDTKRNVPWSSGTTNCGLPPVGLPFWVRANKAGWLPKLGSSRQPRTSPARGPCREP